MKEIPSYLLIVLALISLTVTDALAHKPVDSYLRLQVDGNSISGTWDIAVLDLEATAKLNTKGDKQAIKEFALQHLAISTDSQSCSLHLETGDIADSTIHIKGECPVRITQLKIDYSLLLTIDTQYRGLVFVKAGNNDYTSALSAENPSFTFQLGVNDHWQQFKDYLREGVFHIWTGYDHILFLISLLLSAPFILIKGEWLLRDGFGGTFLQVLKIVTAFTIAHSITLGLVIFDVISLPSRLVESTIALSIIIAAANNLRPTIYRGLWLVTFCFGLIHGMGFADALKELGLPSDARWIALFAFNLGVEIGQVSIVAVVLPIIYSIRHSSFYRRTALPLIALIVIAIALIWFTQRAFGIVLLKGML